MSATREKDQVLADYSAFLSALLPQTEGFLCHDRGERLFWADPQPLADEISEHRSFRNALKRVLNSPSGEGQEVVQVGQRLAYLQGLDDSDGAQHGVLTVVTPVTGNQEASAVYAALQPALRTLHRELSLRFRLMESRRKLTVHATEEKLLHHVESLVHQQQESAKTLDKILELCRTYLGVAQAGIRIPGKQVYLLRSDNKSPDDAAVHLDELIARDRQQSDADCLVLPTGLEATDTRGELVLAGWGKSDFSGRRRRRLARYIASHIRAVVERDFDALTGLLSWPIFEAQLAEQCRSDSRQQHVLMYLDVDQLHVINENYGRVVGDTVLSGFARVLQEQLKELPVSRISSDSFVALLPSGDREFARNQGEAICRQFAAMEFCGEDNNFRASVSIGIAPLEAGQDGGSSSLAAAQVACRAAKDRGSGRVEVYEPADQSIVRRLDDIQQVGRVREAIVQGRLVLLGQPILSIKKDKPFQYLEVLVRMLNEDNELVGPDDFISAAERYQLMQELDRWVVSRTLRNLSETGLTHASDRLRLAINLSGQSLGDEKFLDFVREQLTASSVAPEMLCFEITETVAVANMQRAQAFMHALKRMGCRFSLDDFGTGLSSFAYLKLFPVDTLKIDGSFIRDLATNKVSQSVVAAISEVARVMELDTVAEFVQDEDSLELLRDLGIHWGQGYLLGEPVSLDRQLVKLGDMPAASRTSGFSPRG